MLSPLSVCRHRLGGRYESPTPGLRMGQAPRYNLCSSAPQGLRLRLGPRLKPHPLSAFDPFSVLLSPFLIGFSWEHFLRKITCPEILDWRLPLEEPPKIAGDSASPSLTYLISEMGTTFPTTRSEHRARRGKCSRNKLTLTSREHIAILSTTLRRTVGGVLGLLPRGKEEAGAEDVSGTPLPPWPHPTHTFPSDKFLFPALCL